MGAAAGAVDSGRLGAVSEVGVGAESEPHPDSRNATRITKIHVFFIVVS
jgi:hypothetical protein